MRRKIITILSEYGYWGEELVGPLETFDNAEYSVVFATPKGKVPHALPPSMDAGFIDPPLGRTVVSEEMAQKVKALESSERLSYPLNLSEIIPERPYLSSPNYLKELENYYNRLEEAESELAKYDALLLVGGSGPIVDMVNNQRVHDTILAFYKKDKPIAAECYAIGCLAFARKISDKRCIIQGKVVTGHCIEYDYKTMWGWIDYEFGAPPYPQEYLLRDAVGESGRFIGNFGKSTSTLVDYPFITGRSTSDGYPVGKTMVDVLEKGLRRLGW